MNADGTDRRKGNEGRKARDLIGAICVDQRLLPVFLCDLRLCVRPSHRGAAILGVVSKKRTLILLKPGSSGETPALGSLREVAAALGNCNIAADGSGPHGFGERMGTGVLFGPGMVLEVPLMEEPSINRGEGPEIKQVLVSVTDEDFAFPVLMRLCKVNGWQMMDPDSGRTFG